MPQCVHLEVVIRARAKTRGERPSALNAKYESKGPTLRSMIFFHQSSEAFGVRLPKPLRDYNTSTASLAMGLVVGCTFLAVLLPQPSGKCGHVKLACYFWAARTQLISTGSEARTDIPFSQFLFHAPLSTSWASHSLHLAHPSCGYIPRLRYVPCLSRGSLPLNFLPRTQSRRAIQLDFSAVTRGNKKTDCPL